MKLTSHFHPQFNFHYISNEIQDFDFLSLSYVHILVRGEFRDFRSNWNWHHRWQTRMRILERENAHSNTYHVMWFVVENTRDKLDYIQWI